MAKRNKKLKKRPGVHGKKTERADPQGASSQKETLHRALALHQAGRLPQAEALYRQILLAEPNHPDALHFLGMLAHQVGRSDAAIELINRTLSSWPDYVDAYNSLGIVLSDQGRLDEAVASYRRALALKPDFAEAHTNLGNALKNLGKLEEAVASLRQALTLKPDSPIVHYNLGIALVTQDRLEEAIDRFQQAITLNPDFAEAHSDLGNALMELGRLDEAIASFRRALTLKPDFAEVHSKLGALLGDRGKPDEAIASFRRALALRPDDADTYNNLGNALYESGEVEEAAASFRKAVSLQPEFTKAHYNLGNLLQQWGKLDEAVASYKKALAIRPLFGDVYRNLSLIENYSNENETVRAMVELYARPDLPGEDRMHLGFALGKIFEGLEQYDKAFHYVAEANRLHRSSYEYSIRTDQDSFARIMETFTPAFFALHQGSGHPDETPIFIVGMPRSGTTLVEQILASHPLVFGAGELLDLVDLTTEFCSEATTGPFPGGVLHLDTAAFEKAGMDYIARIRCHSQEAPHITDKMPHNFLLVGFIKAILPRARVIHCRRDPMDNCLSIYKNYFGFKGSHQYGYDLKELGRYYRLYQTLMEHWAKVLPGFLYTIDYEELVADQRQQTEKLLAFCGLAWDEACLDFHRTKRRVDTISCGQVRQPIYQNSVQLWKRYEAQLEPLRTALHDDCSTLR